MDSNYQTPYTRKSILEPLRGQLYAYEDLPIDGEVTLTITVSGEWLKLASLMLREDDKHIASMRKFYDDLNDSSEHYHE